MFDVKACRSCLTVKGKLEKIGDASKRQYSAITGLQISDDGYPVYFCVECRHHIRKSLAFRRKSRRAHFVLKEIMNVRKQISYSDIVTVNRRKTNLESSLNFWVPSNNPCFLIAKDEGQESDIQEPPPPTLQKCEVEQIGQYSRFNSKQLVDIKPDYDPEPEPPEPETNDQDFTEDIPTNDYLEPEPDIDTTNIDMTDIFKDLTEKVESDNDDDGYQEPPPKKKKKIVKETRIDLAACKASTAALLQTVMLFNMKALTLEEQKEKFEARKSVLPFAKAVYKCAMCLTVHKTMNELVEHVKYHNERITGPECEVCKSKFPTQEDITVHVANCHLYEYSCKICQATFYYQGDAVHHTRTHSEDDLQMNALFIHRRRDREKALSDFIITQLSQQMMSDVMVLRNRPEHAKADNELEVVPDSAGMFKCDVCGSGFTTHKDLERHMVLRHRFMYTCKSCMEVFTTRFQALKHHEEAHDPLKCDKCGQTFDNMKRLSKHRSVHNTPMSCNICGYTARNEKFHASHQITEHGYISINDPLLGDPQYKCRQCGVQFYTHRALERHLVRMQHEGAENVRFACVPCKRLYDNDEDLETHYVTCRGGSYPRKCCYCSQLLHTPLQYKLHYFHEHPSLQYRYLRDNCICEICGDSITRPFLESHMRTHSAAVFSCRLCPTTHSSAAAHISHLLSNHMRRPYCCGICRNRFKIRADVKDHILKVHAPTKLFKCEFCEAEFSYFRTLKEHAQKLHNHIVHPIKPKTPPRSKHILYVYAHMMLEVHELERENVSKAKMELLDYLEQKSKPITDNLDYFIFNPEAEEVQLRKKKKKKKKKLSEVQSAVAHITVNWPSDQIKGERSEDAENIEIEQMAQKIEIELTRQDSEMGQFKMEITNEHTATEDEVNKSEVDLSMKVECEEAKTEIVIDNENELQIDEQKPLEVIEQDGHQYVMINGEMYRIAAEDE